MSLFVRLFKAGNQCTDYLAKFGVSSNNDLLIHSTPPEELLDLLRNDALRTIFPRD